MLENLSPQEFDAFVAFGRERLESHEPVASLQELCDKWRAQQSGGALSNADVAAVNSAIEDYRNGDRGRPAEIHLDEVKQRVQAHDQ